MRRNKSRQTTVKAINYCLLFNKRVIVLNSNLQNGANGFIAWCISNNMFNNILKIVYMMLGSRQQLMHADLITLNIENEMIKNADHQKPLGLIIDKNLSWDKQIDAVCANIYSPNNTLEAPVKIH